MIKCAKCGRPFDRHGKDRPVAVIAGEVMGDEYIESFFFCESCGVYTQEIYHDRFLGEDSVSCSGPISRGDGDAIVELIRGCPSPMEKKCSCAAHRSYFEGSSGEGGPS